MPTIAPACGLPPPTATVLSLRWRDPSRSVTYVVLSGSWTSSALFVAPQSPCVCTFSWTAGGDRRGVPSRGPVVPGSAWLSLTRISSFLKACFVPQVGAGPGRAGQRGHCFFMSASITASPLSPLLALRPFYPRFSYFFSNLGRLVARRARWRLASLAATRRPSTSARKKQGRAFIRPAEQDVSPIVARSRYAFRGEPNVDMPLLLAQVALLWVESEY